MQIIFTVIHVLLCAGLIGFVLIQHGKGADMGAAFGSGASSTVFGSRGSGNFLTHTTSVLAAGFFMTSLILAYFTVAPTKPASVLDSALPTVEAPAAEKPSELPAIVPSESTTSSDSAKNELPQTQ